MHTFSHQYRSHVAFPHLLRDKAPDQTTYILERYFIDIQALFFNKLSRIAMGEGITKEDTAKLRALLDEILHVKELLTK